MSDQEDVYVWRAWDCPVCDEINDYDHTLQPCTDLHECEHCGSKTEIKE